MSKQKEQEFRLPGNVVPRHYDICIEPDLEKFSFAGEETIEVEIVEPVDCIMINSAEIEFAELFIENEKGTRLEASAISNDQTELTTISFNGVLGKGVWKIHIKFNGVLSEQLRGFYRSHWKDAEGNDRVLASTHFEPTHARRAFPCFDEPEYKATFKIAFVVPEELNVISNEVVEQESELPNHNNGTQLKRVEFARTMKMSTYLVAFCVGDFVSSQAVNVNGTEIRIWSTPGKEHLTDFALAAACFAVDFYERYFEIPYPGSKIDHIAIPDFPIGAMENLGCITFREKALLVDSQKASHISLLSVANIVMHELAHMWFGDLVTMRWWNGLWLKESFATFMANVCLDAWRPDWNVWNDFAQSRAQALETDALRSTHAIENPVNHPDEASEMFDIISYEKGCSVLYQLHEYLGAELFRKGCAAYLKKHQYANTETHDLWEALEEVCRLENNDTPVRSLMDAWVFTEGHPVIEVRDGTESDTIVISQRRFQLLPEDGSWLLPVPIQLRVEASDGSISSKKLVLETESKQIRVGEGFRSLVVNAGGSGCYRVVYADMMLEKLLQSGIEKLSVVERFNLLNDSWSMVRSGESSAAAYLNLVEKYRQESDFNIWELLLTSLSRLHKLLDSEDRAKIEAVVKGLTLPQVERLGWQAKEDESITDKKIRAIVYEKLGTICGDEEVLAAARKAFDDLSKVDVEMVSTIIYVVAYNGDREDFEEFLTRSKEASTPQDEALYLFALANFRDQALLERATRMCLSGEVRSQNAPVLFAAIVRNEVGAAFAWEFFKEKMQHMQRTYASTAMARLCASFGRLDRPEQAEDVNSFFESNTVKAGETAIRQMLEQLQVNVAFRARESRNLKSLAVET